MLGHHCANPKGGRCDVPCDGRDEPRPTVFLDGPWMAERGRPKHWTQCPVRDTYDDPDIRRVLTLRRQHALGGVVDLSRCAAWVTDLWGQIEAAYAKRRDDEREQAERR